MQVTLERTARSRPRRGTPKARPVPEIFLVGAPSRRLESVAAALGSLRARKRRIDLDLVPRSGWERCVAVVVMEPAPGDGVPDAVERALAARPAKHLPVFVVLSGDGPPDLLERLYRADVAAVFRWPGESTVLPDVLAHIVGTQQVRGQPAGADAAIARAVRARLRPQEEPGDEVVISVRDRIASAFGAIDSLWRKNRLLEVLSRVPRIRHVEAEDLRVAPTDTADRDLARSIRKVLAAASEELAGTVGVSVERGFVTLAGTVPDRRRLSHLLDIVSRLRGVRGIENLTTVAPDRQERERQRAREIGRAARRMFSSENVDVAVFGNTGVLSGTVETLRDRTGLEEFVSRYPSIRKVINKLHVA